jgi:hypothetical protein
VEYWVCFHSFEQLKLVVLQKLNSARIRLIRAAWDTPPPKQCAFRMGPRKLQESGLSPVRQLHPAPWENSSFWMEVAVDDEGKRLI